MSVEADDDVSAAFDTVQATPYFPFFKSMQSAFSEHRLGTETNVLVAVPMIYPVLLRDNARRAA